MLTFKKKTQNKTNKKQKQKQNKQNKQTNKQKKQEMEILVLYSKNTLSFFRLDTLVKIFWPESGQFD